MKQLYASDLYNIENDGIIQVMQTFKNSQAMWFVVFVGLKKER
jgi:hypothetical protein